MVANRFRIWAISALLFMLLFNFSIFFWDFYSGSDTIGFGVLEPYKGMGMFYVYVISLFSSFIVISAILWSNQKGMGFLVWLPYAVIGFFVEYYFEIAVLKSIWGVIGYCVFGLITGLSADLSFFLLRKYSALKPQNVAGFSGLIMSAVYYGTIIVAIGFFYKSGWGAGSILEPGTFLGVAYFMLPWMLINAFSGGYLAYAVFHFHFGEK